MARAAAPRAGSTSIPVNATGAGTSTLVAGQSGKRIYVYSYAVVVDNAGTVKFQNTGGTDLTGAMSFASNGGISCAAGDDPWFYTAVGSGLDLVVSAATRGHLSYVIE